MIALGEQIKMVPTVTPIAPVFEELGQKNASPKKIFDGHRYGAHPSDKKIVANLNTHPCPNPRPSMSLRYIYL